MSSAMCALSSCKCLGGQSIPAAAEESTATAICLFCVTYSATFRYLWLWFTRLVLLEKNARTDSSYPRKLWSLGAARIQQCGKQESQSWNSAWKTLPRIISHFQPKDLPEQDPADLFVPRCRLAGRQLHESSEASFSIPTMPGKTCRTHPSFFLLSVLVDANMCQVHHNMGASCFHAFARK